MSSSAFTDSGSSAESAARLAGTVCAKAAVLIVRVARRIAKRVMARSGYEFGLLELQGPDRCLTYPAGISRSKGMKLAYKREYGISSRSAEDRAHSDHRR